MAAALVVAGQAFGAPDAPGHGALSYVMQVRLQAENPFGTGTAEEGFAAELSVRGSRSRLSFQGARGERGVLLHDAESGEAWLLGLDRASALPVGTGLFTALRVAPEAPCTRLPRGCRPVDAKVVAGGMRRGWRYRGADGQGPGGTSEGDFWIDDQTGVVLAYRGRSGGMRRDTAMVAAAVVYQPVSDAAFELPSVDRAAPRDDASRRADPRWRDRGRARD